MTSDPADLFAGRYLLGTLLGSGGSGSVRRAQDTVLDRPVAVKLLRSGSVDDVTTARLRAEARLAGSLHHPGIAQVYDFGEAPYGEHSDRSPYIVMQLVEGESLAAQLRRSPELPVDDVVRILAEAADALQVAHEAGIVHRDLKPGNIVMTPSGRPVLVDFGIARSAGFEPLTLTGTIVGTVDYLSPEQAQGQSATVRSDLYSLGMVAYEALSGTRPLHRESPVATALAQVQDDVPPLPAHVPPAVSALVLQMLAKEPAQRPASAAEVARRAAATSYDPAEPVTTVLASTGRSSRRVLGGAAVLAAVLVASLLVGATSEVTRVPDLRGLSVSEARAVLQARDLVDVERGYVDDPDAERGTVLAQEPRPGARAEESTTVVLEVASGRMPVAADLLLGKDYARAAREVVGLGLVPSRAQSARAEGVGTVVGVSPTGRLTLGSTVVLTVAVAPTPVSAPAPALTKPAPTSKPAGAEATKPQGAAKPGKSKHKGKSRGKGKQK